jgi:hypothetical protein
LDHRDHFLHRDGGAVAVAAHLPVPASPMTSLMPRAVFEHAGEDHRHQHARHVHLKAGNAGGARGERHLRRELGKIAPHAAAPLDALDLADRGVDRLWS